MASEEHIATEYESFLSIYDERPVSNAEHGERYGMGLTNMSQLNERQAAAADALRKSRPPVNDGTNVVLSAAKRLKWYARLVKVMDAQKMHAPEQFKEFCRRAGASLVGWHYSPWPGAVFTITSDSSEYDGCVTVRDAAGGFFPLQEELAWAVAVPPTAADQLPQERSAGDPTGNKR